MESRGERNLLQRAVQVLDLMVGTPDADWGVRELARTCKWPPSTVFRVLRALEEQGIVQTDRSAGRYRLGLELFRIASMAMAGFPIRRLALPLMRELVDACNETALLLVYDPVRMEAMWVASVESQHPLRYVVELGKRLPVYAGASGLGIMAFLPEAERREIVARTQLAPLTDRTISNPIRLEQEMELIRRKGYAFSIGQRIPGAVGISAPIWGPDSRVVGALQLTIPEPRFNPAAEPDLARLVMRYARRITEHLGGKVPDLQGQTSPPAPLRRGEGSDVAHPLPAWARGPGG